MTLTELYKLLVDHDWSYNYSDDQTYYLRGSNEASTLVHARKISEEHDALYKAYVNYLYNDGEKPEAPNSLKRD